MLIKSSCETTTQIYPVVLGMQHVLRPLAMLDKITGPMQVFLWLPQV